MPAAVTTAEPASCHTGQRPPVFRGAEGRCEAAVPRAAEAQEERQTPVRQDEPAGPVAAGPGAARPLPRPPADPAPRPLATGRPPPRAGGRRGRPPPPPAGRRPRARAARGRPPAARRVRHVRPEELRLHPVRVAPQPAPAGGRPRGGSALARAGADQARGGAPRPGTVPPAAPGFPWRTGPELYTRTPSAKTRKSTERPPGGGVGSFRPTVARGEAAVAAAWIVLHLGEGVRPQPIVVRPAGHHQRVAG